ncbi:helix-turn-helix domain-containing protein [Flavobacterium aquiphilum]|uniref:helix-turn-helix domain-containing protein n=1 Tax=Flavobacterium aquiphilum TaxID=3003261 RepID=UPI00247FEED3|nr:helix-turn-helix transcriptional regulator [Flavobacterium aquiphilum]
MTRYRNKIALKHLGEKIKAQRIKAGMKIDDLAEMTGFSYNTISNMENGYETYLSYFIEVCFALNCHPKEIMDVELDVKSRFQLSPSRIEKSRLTDRINVYIQNNYFKTPKSTSEVVQKLKEEYDSDFESKNVSVILLRFTKANILKIIKKGNRNLYNSNS